MSNAAIYLDTMPLLDASVGYGQLGMGGSLGYEGKAVAVRSQLYSHALSAHAPARILFQLNGRFCSFLCQVALNDDVSASISEADFFVLADGREVAVAASVRAGEPPRRLHVAIPGAQRLELITRTTRWECCHAVWLDPQVDEMLPEQPYDALVDCLNRAQVAPLPVLPAAERCIVTVASPRFAGLLDDMLGSLYANGGCQEAMLVVFGLDADQACAQVAAKYQAHFVRCRSLSPINATSKGLLYSAALVINAQQFLCLDADMLVLGDLRPVFAALDACPLGSILVCREGNGHGLSNLEHAFQTVYWGSRADWQQVFNASAEEAAYPLVVNDGLFAGNRAALLALDGVIRAMPQAAAWIDQHRNNWWRNQFVFNLALARLRCGVELDPTYNVQLHTQEVQITDQYGRMRASWHGRPVRVLHFCGAGRHKYPEWRSRFASIDDPLTGTPAGDSYAVFLDALRAWVGRHGLRGLAWSFYGTTDATSARVRDPSTMPLLALLHYVIRANGCVRVLETGTARGISAACLASAVIHRSGGQVVTFDPYAHAERTELWAGLPESWRACIEERAVGSLEGMAAALEAGECYDAALLDSIHTAEHVWAEFQLAAQLVCPGGLILIHDVRYAHGTVEQALRQIEAAGYGVTRLWTAESGVLEDDHLGLALIENRLRSLEDRR